MARSSPMVPDRKMNGMCGASVAAMVRAERPSNCGSEKSDRMISVVCLRSAARKSASVSTRTDSQSRPSARSLRSASSASVATSSTIKTRTRTATASFHHLRAKKLTSRGVLPRSDASHLAIEDAQLRRASSQRPRELLRIAILRRKINTIRAHPPRSGCALKMNNQEDSRKRAATMRDLQQRNRELQRSLEAANKELDDLIYSVAHDLRAPLTHLDGFSQLLLDSASGTLSGEDREHLGRIIDASRHMHELIAALLEYSRLNRAPLAMGEQDLEELLEQALSAAAPLAAGRNIQWQRSRLPRVRGDAGQLQQVLAVLIANAIK